MRNNASPIEISYASPDSKAERRVQMNKENSVTSLLSSIEKSLKSESINNSAQLQESATLLSADDQQDLRSGSGSAGMTMSSGIALNVNLNALQGLTSTAIPKQPSLTPTLATSGDVPVSLHVSSRVGGSSSSSSLRQNLRQSPPEPGKSSSSSSK